MSFNLAEAIQSAIGYSPDHIVPLLGGCIGEVYRIEIQGQPSLVAKVSRAPDVRLGIEAWMLRYLRQHTSLPVPEVLYSDSSRSSLQ